MSANSSSPRKTTEHLATLPASNSVTALQSSTMRAPETASQTADTLAKPMQDLSFRMKKTPSKHHHHRKSQSPTKTSKPAPLRIQGTFGTRIAKSNIVVGRIPTPRSGTFKTIIKHGGLLPTPPSSNKTLKQAIIDHRKSHPESCDLMPSTDWYTCLSPSFLSPNIYPAEQIEVKVADTMAMEEGAVNGDGEDEEINGDDFWLDIESDDDM